MAHLRDDDEQGVSLFPMFNILACTLGVMVFILATVATVSLGADKAVELVTPDLSDGMPRRAPTWLEWDGRELVLRPSLARVEFDQDLAAIPTFDETYDYMFERLAGSPVGGELANVALDSRNRYVVLLVRPSGFDTLEEIRGYLELLGINVVHEPIDQAWRRVRMR